MAVDLMLVGTKALEMQEEKDLLGEKKEERKEMV